MSHRIVLIPGDGIGPEVAAEYADVPFQDMQIDDLSVRLARHPSDFDILLLPNLYGDIISDLCAGLVGELGLIPGTNIGWEYAVFEPVHGSAPDIAGQEVANPIAMIPSGAMMLRHLNEPSAAARIESAVDSVLGKGEARRRDLGGSSSTMQIAEAIAAEVAPPSEGDPRGADRRPPRGPFNSPVGRGSRSNRAEEPSPCSPR